MYRTLYIVLLFAFAASALSDREDDSVGGRFEKCKTAFNISDPIFRSTNPGILIKNPKTRCYAACVLTAIQTLKEDGSLNLEQLISRLPQYFPDRNQIIQDYNSCANETGADACETAYKTIKCLDAQKAH